MQQDRRWNARVPLVMEAALYYSGLGIVRCRTRNISLDGAYIETGRISLGHNAALEMILCQERPGSVSDQCRLQANIARVDGVGAGLSFLGVSPENRNYLQWLMNSVIAQTAGEMDSVFLPRK